MAENETPEIPPTDSEESPSPEAIWNDTKRRPRETGEGADQIWGPEGNDRTKEPVTEAPEALTTALSRLDRLERTMERLAEQFDQRPVSVRIPEEPQPPGDAPRAVTEILRSVTDVVGSRLDQFTLLVGRRLDGVENLLREFMKTNLWQTDQEAAARIEALDGAIERSAADSRADIAALTDRLSHFAEAVREALQSATGRLEDDMTTAVDTLADRIEGLLGGLLEPVRERADQVRDALSQFAATAEDSTEQSRHTLEEATAGLAQSRDLIDVRLRQFVEAFGNRMSEAETTLGERVSTELDTRLTEAMAIQGTQLDVLREVASRLDETLMALRASVEEAAGALRASVGEQLGTQSEVLKSTVERLDRVTAIVESLGRKRGFRELIESEKEVRAGQAALVGRITAAGEALTSKVEGVEGRLEGLVRTVEEQQRSGLAREQELRQMTVALGQVLRESLDRAESQLRTGAAEEIGGRLSEFDKSLERRLAVVARNEAQVERISAGLLKLQVQVSETFADSMGELRRSLTEDVARQLTDEVDRRLEKTRSLISETVSAGAEANVQDLAKLRHEVREAMAGLGSEVGNLRTGLEDGVRRLEQETSATLEQLGQSIEKRFTALVESPRQAPARKKSTARKRASGSPPEASS